MHYLIAYKDAMKFRWTLKFFWKPQIYVWLLKCKCELKCFHCYEHTHWSHIAKYFKYVSRLPNTNLKSAFTDTT